MRNGIESLYVYSLSMEIGELVWNTVSTWDIFAKQTIGNNFVRAADSIAYNISEGYGRYFFKENRNFCWIARGSLNETKTALEKAHKRNLINDDQFNLISEKLSICLLKLNNYIIYIQKQIPLQKNQ